MYTTRANETFTLIVKYHLNILYSLQLICIKTGKGRDLYVAEVGQWSLSDHTLGYTTYLAEYTTPTRRHGSILLPRLYICRESICLSD